MRKTKCKIICEEGCKNYRKMKGEFKIFDPSSRSGKSKKFRTYGIKCRKGEGIDIVIKTGRCVEHTNPKYH